MFTGIIEEVGQVVNVIKKADNVRLTILAKFKEKPNLGDSIAINGACMTVCEHLGEQTYGFDVSLESLKRTNLNELQPKEYVNLERSLKVGGRMDGHFVSGHVDNMGKVSRIEENQNDRLYYFNFPEHLKPQIVSKGCIAVNGVSLTVIEPNRNEFHVTIVPYTYTHTNFHLLKVGSSVNIETDLLSKYVQGMIQKEKNNITKDFITNAGF